MKRRWPIIWLLLALLVGCCGCQAPETQPAPVERNRIRIGFSMATLMEDRWLRDRDIFLAKAQQRDIEVVIRNANKDSDTQYEQVLELLESDIDVLVIAPNDAEREARCVSAAKTRGVPVVIYDRFIRNSNADVYIAFDNIMVGRLMGEYLLDAAAQGGYLLVNGPQSDNNCLMIREGYMEVLKPHIDAGDIWIASEEWSEEWLRENAYDAAVRCIREHGEALTAAVCGNDSLAWGVIDALSENQLGGVTVVGMDADLAACQRIVAGRQAMTVYKPIQNLVDEALSVCEKLATGKDLATTQTLFDGSNDIAYIAIDVYAVTEQTMAETVIADGFHMEAEIYG